MSSKKQSDLNLAVAGLGLTGEAGEVADLIKKTVGHGHALDRDKVLEEVGDVLWYVAMLTTLLDADLSSIAAANVEKLRRRYPNGFDPERSKHRDAQIP
jgi:NTP pyrophosphatase (non-canonical NTP hydrolase)